MAKCGSPYKKVYLYWIGPRVSDIQDCDGLFDGAITLYGFGKEPTFDEFYGTLEQSINGKKPGETFENPNFCHSRYNILEGKNIGTTRINHNLDSKIQDMFILLHELDIISRKEKNGEIVRFMTYNPNHVGRHGEDHYFQLFKELIWDFKNKPDENNEELMKSRMEAYANCKVNPKDIMEIFRLLGITGGEGNKSETDFFSRVVGYVDSKWNPDKAGLEELPEKICDFIIEHMLCMNLNEELMHKLEYKDRFRELCSELEVGTTEGIRFVMPNKFIESGKTFKELSGNMGSDAYKSAKAEYEKERDKNFADLKKLISGDKIVLQEKQSSGGFGTYLIKESKDLDAVINDLNSLELTSKLKDYIVSRYRDPNISLNIHAILTEYDVLLLPPSIQNIMTLSNKLIYSGADFYAYGKFAEQNPVMDSEFREYVSWICRSLQARGYRGVIGFDTIVSKEGIEFVEANNRFQASTVLINKSFKEQRYLTTEEGLPVRRFDGNKIRQESILPSVQALNIISFMDVYRKNKDKGGISDSEKNQFVCNYCICKDVQKRLHPWMNEQDSTRKSKEEKNDMAPSYSGLVNVKVPYSCFIYYEDEGGIKEHVSRTHYLHMVKRCGEMWARAESQRPMAIARTLGPIFKAILSISKDYIPSSFGVRLQNSTENNYPDDLVDMFFKGHPDAFKMGVKGVIDAIFIKKANLPKDVDPSNVFNDLAELTAYVLERDENSCAGIVPILDILHRKSIEICSTMEHEPEYYCTSKNGIAEIGRDGLTTFAKACIAMRRLACLRDRLVSKGEDCIKVRKPIPLFANAPEKWDKDQVFMKQYEHGLKMMRDLDRAFRDKRCVIPAQFTCNVFDKDIGMFGTANEPDLKDDDDYCRPGAFAVKLIFVRNMMSVLGMSVYRDPNSFPPSVDWYNKIRNREILPVKIALVNNGVYLGGDELREEIRAGVNHSIDLTFETDAFTFHHVKENKIDINCECDTPTSVFTPFRVTKAVQNKGKREVTISYYGTPLLKGEYELPILALENERLDKYGIPLNRIAFVATDRVRFQHSDCCKFASTGRGCKFCEFTAKGESTTGNTQYHFKEEEIRDAIDNTFDILDKATGLNIHVEHALIGGGTMPGDPSEVKARILSMCRAIQRRRPDANIYLMSTPPAILSDMDDYKDAGITEVSFNMEVYDHHLASQYMPGKRSISTSGYLAALRYATTVWGTTGNVRSALILGLESLESAEEGIRVLTSMGVSPILSIFRPTPGTKLEWMKPFDSESLYRFYLAADDVCESMGMEFGPACLHCQNNTLALPRELKSKCFAAIGQNKGGTKV